MSSLDEGLAVGAALREVVLGEVDERTDLRLAGDVLRGSTAVGGVGVGRDVGLLGQVGDEVGVLDAQQDELVVEDQHADEGVEVLLGEAARQRSRGRLVAAGALLRDRRTLVGARVVERSDQSADLGKVAGTERTRHVCQDALGVVADDAQDELNDPDAVRQLDVVGDERLAQRDGGCGDLQRNAKLHGRLVGRLLVLDQAEELAQQIEHEVRAVVVPGTHVAVVLRGPAGAVLADPVTDSEDQDGDEHDGNDAEHLRLRERSVMSSHVLHGALPFQELTCVSQQRVV